MAKILKELFKEMQKNKSKNDLLDQEMMKGHACYVLITCGNPTEDGNMQVEMVYEGDKVLASYLVESAQGFLENQLDIS